MSSGGGQPLGERPAVQPQQEAPTRAPVIGPAVQAERVIPADNAAVVNELAAEVPGVQEEPVDVGTEADETMRSLAGATSSMPEARPLDNTTAMALPIGEATTGLNTQRTGNEPVEEGRPAQPEPIEQISSPAPEAGVDERAEIQAKLARGEMTREQADAATAKLDAGLVNTQAPSVVEPESEEVREEPPGAVTQPIMEGSPVRPAPAMESGAPLEEEDEVPPASGPAIPAKPAQEAKPKTEEEAMRERIDNVTNADGAVNADRQKRKDEYHAAKQNAEKLNQEAAAAGGREKLSAEKQTELANAEKTIGRTERDVELEERAEKIAKMPEGKEKATAQEALKNDQIGALKNDSLDDNPDYQKAQEALRDQKNDKWRELDAKPQDQKDMAIDAMNAKDRKAYQDYVEQRERVNMTAQEAEWKAREDLLNRQEKALSPNDQAGRDRITQERRMLEKDRRKGHQESILARDERYQKLQKTNRDVENKLRELYGDEADDRMRDLATEGDWDKLSDAVKKVFDHDPRKFNDYKRDRDEMNGREASARSTVNSRRLEQNYDPDGNKITGTPKEVAERKGQIIQAEQMQEKHRGPGVIRKGFRRFAHGLDNFFGKGPLEDHRRKAFGYANRLRNDYGFWRGFVLPKDEQAKILRRLMLKEMGAWGGRSIARKVFLAGLLLVAYWLFMPIVMGKALEMTKPFGGNQ